MNYLLNKMKIAAVLAMVVGVLALGATALHQASAAPAADPAAAAPPGAKAAPRLDLYQDPLPPDALARLGTQRWRHSGAISFVAFADDGKTLISAGLDNTARQWDLATGKELRRFGQPQNEADRSGMRVGGQVMLFTGWVGVDGGGSVALSTDGKVLAQGGRGNVIRLWDTGTGKELLQIKAPQGGESSLSLSPDGKMLATRGTGQPMRLWDTSTGKQIRQFARGERDMVAGGFGVSAAFSPDGKIFAAADMKIVNQQVQALVMLWDVDSGKELRSIKAGGPGAFSVFLPTFSPDGKTIAWGSQDGTIGLHEVATGKEIRQIKGPQFGAASLVFAPYGKVLASKGMDGVIRLWEVETGKQVRTLGASAQTNQGMMLALYGMGGLAYSPDGKTLASGGDNTFRLWQADSGKEIRLGNGHQGAVGSVSFLADGKTLMTRGNDGAVRIWEAASGKEVRQIAVPEHARVAALSPDGRLLAAVNGEKSITLLEAATGKELHKLPGHPNDTGALAFSTDGKLLASRGGDQMIRLYEAATGREVRQISADFTIAQDLRETVVFSPDGRLIAAAGMEKAADQRQLHAAALKLWDTTTGKEVRHLRSTGTLGSGTFVFSPDGRMLAWDVNGTITLHETATGKERGQLGKAQVKGDNTTDVFGRLMSFVSGAAPDALAFSPDSRLLARGSADQTIRIWDVGRGKELGQLKGHQGSIASVSFAPDGRTLASASADTTVLVWDVARFHEAVKPQAAELSPQDAESRWNDLAGDDAAKAWQAIHALAAAPKQAVPLFQERLKPAVPADAKRVEQLIADLDNNEFAVRQRAMDELEKLGELAVHALQKTLKDQPPLETRNRVEQLLEKAAAQDLSPDRLRLVRAVEALEYLGTPEAKHVLRTLAQGAPGTLLTRQVQAALDRLGK